MLRAKESSASRFVARSREIDLRDVALVVSGEKMRLKLMEEDTICDRLVAVEADLLVPSCSAWREGSRRSERLGFLKLSENDVHAGPFIG